MLEKRNFWTKIVIFGWYEIIPLTAIHWTALKFSKISQKFCLGSLKFLGFSSSLIFGPLEKYKVGEAYRWDCLLPFYVFLSPALSQGQNLTVPPPEKVHRYTRMMTQNDDSDNWRRKTFPVTQFSLIKCQKYKWQKIRVPIKSFPNSEGSGIIGLAQRT